jgi:UDP-glucose 4-epimerase
MRVAVTGASGFIGRALMTSLAAREHHPVALSRDALADGMEGAEAVIHLAGLAHRTGPDAPSAEAFRRANTALPLVVQAAARAAGVRRMIHVSTISVLSGHAGLLREAMPPAPTTDYDCAKAEAEAALAERAGPALTLVRPSLVYGPGAKGNLARLLALCRRPIPLPFAAVHNHRSLVGLSNLVDALIFLLGQDPVPIAHVTDGHDLSLGEIVGTLRAGLGSAAPAFPLPPGAMAAALRLVGRGRMADQLFGDLRVEMGALPRLGWQPPYAPGHDLRAMAAAARDR